MDALFGMDVNWNTIISISIKIIYDIFTYIGSINRARDGKNSVSDIHLPITNATPNDKYLLFQVRHIFNIKSM